MLGTILIIVLVLFLIGGAVPFGPWGGPGPVAQPGQPGPGWNYHGYGWGTGGGGILGVILIVLLILFLLGRI